jgi:pyridoxamine 5'-phosphate oxidase
MANLQETDLHPDPFQQFRAWLDAAVASQPINPDAMTLATATRDGRPSARMVLLKGIDERGFVFFTNYESRKAAELEANPHAALCFYWPALERQVRIEGRVERTTAAESDAYFQSRPWGSRLGALASPQSQVIPSRDVLEQRMKELLRQYPDHDIPRPVHWGGYRLIPTLFEFWQGQPNRLHDRLCYERRADGGWDIRRLAP